jgi:hypothetical protein
MLAGSLAFALVPAVALLATTPSAAAPSQPAHPAKSSTYYSSLASVSVAPHSTTAYALGSHGSTTQTPYALKRTGGHWVREKVQHVKNGSLTSVAAGSSSLAWAVGLVYQGSAYYVLIERSTGKGFTRMSSVKITGTLYSVAASSRTNAWAVGDTNAGAALVVHWNGKTWKTVSTGLTQSVTSVSTTSPSNVWVFGNATAGPTADHWNGKKWTTSTIGSTADSLTGIGSSSGKNAWAVGYAFVSKGSSGSDKSVTFHWNGSRWTKVAAPSPGAQTYLESVTVHGSTAYASGSSAGKTGVDTSPVVLKFSGGKWKAEKVTRRGQASYLNSISTSSKLVAAVGSWYVHPPCTAHATPPNPYIVSPHGSTWGQVSSPDTVTAAAITPAMRKC